MLKVLEPLHEKLEEGAMRNNTTIKEKAFIQAWDLYYHVFRRIDKQLQTLTTLDLQSVSPELLECRDLELAVPGSYIADSPEVKIASFAPQLSVITSKQRPRKLTILGSDGKEYTFLLKGHEDLRQDERVMQVFLSFREFAFLHSLAHVPVNKGTLRYMRSKLMSMRENTLATLVELESCRWLSVPLQDRHRGQQWVAVVYTTLENSRAPVDKLDSPLSLDGCTYRAPVNKVKLWNKENIM
ncbi:unnamed protein product [Fraxinus pennsylvanica]|uniref:PI3K/PI4K catalytic domain-containing protein n=1 Tax=Fraxinus pennsylvanica TaxID=56036 RepID=A0AAD1ZLJ2_9LAMI|nr:unnamed protein product [Fraxinus pennsylvanica]